MAEEAKKDAGAPAGDAAAKPDQGKKAAAGKEEKTMGKFVHGDYMVHVLFQKGKKFIFEEERTLNLIIEVDVAGNKQYSNPKSDVAANQDAPIIWDEHLFFELKNLSPKEAKDANIVIRLLNQGWLKNELVGQAIIDLASVYFTKKNKMEHYWVGLDNPDSEDFENMKGLLKISANCTGPNDNAQKLEMAVGPEPAKLKMYMSPSIKRTFYELTISIIQAEKMPEYGIWSPTLEAYFKVKYGGGNPVKTSIHNQVNEKVPVNEHITIPVQTPVLQDRLVVEAYDSNITSDVKIGSLLFSAKQLIAEGEKEGGFFIWRNMNGAPIENNNEHADKMNECPDLASDWKGFVLLHIQAKENDKPQKGMKNMDPEIKKRAVAEGYLKKEQYQVQIEVGQGITLPEEDQDYRVVVKVMDKEWRSDVPKEKKGAYVRWHRRSELLTWDLPKNEYSVFAGKTAEELGKNRVESEIFIYLEDESEKLICFWQGKLSEFRQADAKWRWIQLKPDRSYGEVEEDYMAGMISVKISVTNITKNGGPVDLSKTLAWRKPPPQRIGAYQVRCFIFQCRDLPAADSDGSSDPFIQVFNTSGEDVRTPVIEDNINPIFMEPLEIALDYLDAKDMQDAPPIVMDIMDADEGFISDSADFLGRCVVHLKDIPKEELSEGSEIPVPKWYPIKFGTDEDSPECGQILVSFAKFDAEVIPKPLDYMDEAMHDMVEQLDFDVFINCLGLRELESIGLIPIQKAFISFMVKSLTDPKKSGQLQNIKTQPGPAGPNPNINSIVKFNIPLPIEKLYVPALSCTVYDQVFLGFSQPVVGTFTIPLGEIMQSSWAERKKILKDADEIIAQLKLKLGGKAVDTNQILLNMAGTANNAVTQLISTRNPTTLTAPGAASLKIAVESDDDEIGEVQDDSFVKTKGVSQMMASSKDANAASQNANQLLSPKTSVTGESGRAGPAKSKLGKKEDDKEAQREEIKKIEEEKQQAKQQRKEEARKLLETVDTSHNVSIPNYIYDQQLRVYREVMPPKNELFKPVGFNDQDLIKELMALMNKIPPSAASNPKIARQNARLAKKVKAEAKKSGNQEIIEQEAAEPNQEEVELGVNLMQQVYDKTNKHYRRYFEDELENDKEIFPKPIFTNIDIKRGQSRGVQKSWFGGGQQDESGQESTIRVIGKFKGVIDIFNKDKKERYEVKKEAKLKEIFQLLGDLYHKTTGDRHTFDLSVVDNEEAKVGFEEKLTKMDNRMPLLVTFLQDVTLGYQIKEALSRKTDAVAHLYLIQGYEFASRDIGSPSDPFVLVTCGDQTEGSPDDYQEDEPNPRLMCRYDFNVSFPGAPPLVIEAYDYDLLFGNDLIGKTTIDLDDRFFNPKWQAIDEKPIETRELYHQSSKLNQGVIDLWVDIDPATKSSDVGKVWDISKEPVNDFEVRLSVFKCKNVPAEDAEGVSDVFIKAFISENDRQETDTHYREQKGTPSFNYRLLFGVQTPTIKPFILTMQAWDRDLIASNDMICEWRIDITEMVRDSKITKGPINLQKNYYNDSLKQRICKPGEEEPLKFIEKEKDGNLDNTFYLTAFHPEDTEKKKPIYIYLDLRVVPREFAEMNKVGAARGEPNVEPNLPPPVGRFKLSLNPISMLNQLCGPSLRRKIWCCICCLLCCVIIYYVFPLLASFKTLFE